MRIGIMTDMEGLAGVDHWEQCYAEDDDAATYRHGLEQLAADTNAAVAGCFDAGATEVIVWDGHGRNLQQAFTRVDLDPRAQLARVVAEKSVRIEGVDADLAGVLMIGQHAMAGTTRAFLDHTQNPKDVCRFTINGEEHGEMSQFALYAGAAGVPLLYAAGDECLCAEAARLFPWVHTTATKRSTGWSTCSLYPVHEVRAAIRRDVADAIRQRADAQTWRLTMPLNLAVEFAWSALADERDGAPGVSRPHARVLAWTIDDPRLIYDWPRARKQ